jgi:CBS domain-containing protein
MNDEITVQPPAPLTGPEKLKQIAEQLRKEQISQSVTVRELLRWFGAHRRGSFIVEWIRGSLSEAKLATKPEFEWTYIDGPIEFILAQEGSATQTAAPVKDAEHAVLGVGQITADPTYRIGKLRSANMPPVSVTPQQKIIEAITIMLANDFSQLPVMEGERDVKGIISWTAIGSRLALGAKCSEVRDCMDVPHVISADTSLFDAINEIVTNQYVLIRDSTNKLSGIVTTSRLRKNECFSVDYIVG